MCPYWYFRLIFFCFIARWIVFKHRWIFKALTNLGEFMHFLPTGNCYSSYRPNSLLAGRKCVYFHPAMRTGAALSAPDWIGPARLSRVLWSEMWWCDGMMAECERASERERFHVWSCSVNSNRTAGDVGSVRGCSENSKGFQCSENLTYSLGTLSWILRRRIPMPRRDLIFILATFCYALVVVTQSSFRLEEGIIVLRGGRIKSLSSFVSFVTLEKHCIGSGLEFKLALDCRRKKTLKHRASWSAPETSLHHIPLYTTLLLQTRHRRQEPPANVRSLPWQNSKLE